MIKYAYFRVDANSVIGTGHLIRCEILADELNTRGIQTAFICTTIPNKYKKKLILI